MLSAQFSQSLTVLIFLSVVHCASSAPAQVFDTGLTTPPRSPLQNIDNENRNQAWTDVRNARNLNQGPDSTRNRTQFILPKPGPIITPVSLMPEKPRLLLEQSSKTMKRAAAFEDRKKALLKRILSARSEENHLAFSQAAAAMSVLHAERISWLRQTARQVVPTRPSINDSSAGGRSRKPNLVIPSLPLKTLRK